MPDYDELFLRDDARKEKELERMPMCSHCNEHIQDEYLFDLGGGEIYCKECTFKLFREDVADYV